MHLRPRFQRLAILAASVCTLAAAGRISAGALDRHWSVHDLPVLPERSSWRSLADLRPVRVTMTIEWHKVPVATTVEQLTRSPFLWRNMHFDDWDRIAPSIRARALDRLLRRYEPIIGGPDAWAVAGAQHWDQVPQPVRAVVFPEIVAHWAAFYQVGARFGHDPVLVRDTLSAIMMGESWFEHRALNVNQWGNRDLGLGGCSDRCRRVLAEMADRGELDFRLEETDYDNPWHASRALVAWFDLELSNADGDLDVAIRAYHRGHRAAMDERGEAYLTNIRRLRAKYFSGDMSSPTWRVLREWARSRSSILPPAPPPIIGVSGSLGPVATLPGRSVTLGGPSVEQLRPESRPLRQ